MGKYADPFWRGTHSLLYDLKRLWTDANSPLGDPLPHAKRCEEAYYDDSYHRVGVRKRCLLERGHDGPHYWVTGHIGQKSVTSILMWE